MDITIKVDRCIISFWDVEGDDACNANRVQEFCFSEYSYSDRRLSMALKFSSVDVGSMECIASFLISMEVRCFSERPRIVVVVDWR